MKLLHIGQAQRRAPAAFPARFALTMTLLLAFCAAPAAPVLADETPPAFLDKWGAYGTFGFYCPCGMAVDPATGDVYVADRDNHCIQKFDGSDWTVFAGTKGSYGSGDYGLWRPYDVAVDSEGNVYVADSYNGRVQEFDSSGAFVRTVASCGPDDGYVQQPKGVAVDSDDNVYVSDYSQPRIEKFSSSGVYLGTWGGSGGGESGFYLPVGLAVDMATNHVYVVDSGNHRIQEFTSSGEFIRMWGSQGAGNGEFSWPEGVAVDSAGNVYVADTGNDRMQKFDSEGNYLTKWGSSGMDDGLFEFPMGVTVDANGIIYVADLGTIQSFGEQTTVDVDIELHTGWNMVSVPVEADDMSVDAVFPDAEAVYTWNPSSKSYETPATVEPERSYWVAVTKDDTVTVTGTPVTEWTDTLTAGWNMAGSVYGNDVAVGDLVDLPDGSVQTNAIYHWNPTAKSYDTASQIEQGLGYWMPATQACDLTVAPSA